MYVNSQYEYIQENWDELNCCFTEYRGRLGLTHEGATTLVIESVTGEVLWAWEND